MIRAAFFWLLALLGFFVAAIVVGLVGRYIGRPLKWMFRENTLRGFLLMNLIICTLVVIVARLYLKEISDALGGLAIAWMVVMVVISVFNNPWKDRP